MSNVTAVLMAGNEGPSAAELYVQGGRLAAARDALHTLKTLPEIDRIIVVTPDLVWAEWQAKFDYTLDLDEPGQPFHFGRRLSQVCERFELERIFYLGSGSIPLLGREAVAEAVAQIARAEAPTAVTNNLHSSDWLAVSTVEPIVRLPHRLPKDNSLGWVLRTEAGVTVRGLPASAASRVDIDTPFDLMVLSMYPGLGGELGKYLAAATEQPAQARLRDAIGVLGTAGSQAAIIGRLASGAWAHLEAHTQVWLRVFSEERGMAASGRQDAGQVRSLIALHLEAVGPDAFFRELGGMSQAAFVDTRLLLAHHRLWPSSADRYRSDLGEWAEIEVPWLRELTRAGAQAPMPVVFGGHGVVAGGLYAIVEILKAGV